MEGAVQLRVSSRVDQRDASHSAENVTTVIYEHERVERIEEKKEKRGKMSVSRLERFE